ncbi:hypothetical protein P3S68_025776 [Capsicum galapagoense]
MSESFTMEDFRSLNKGIKRLKKYVGEVNNIHRRCFKMMLDLMNPKQSILASLDKQSEKIKDNFLDLLKWYANKKEEVKNVVLEKAPKNSTMTSPDIQKDIVSSCAKETVKAIIEDLNGNFFEILVDESKDVSHK